MTLYQFNALDDIEQAEAIWEHGVLLRSRDEGDYRYILYQIDSFYVELHYHMQQNAIEKARVFANPDHLQPYLDEMTITI